MIRSGRHYLSLIFISFLFLLTSCVSLNRRQFSAEEEEALYPLATYVPDVFLWEEVCPGLARFDFENPDFPLRYHAVRIELGAEDSDGAENSDVAGGLKILTSQWEQTAAFAARESCKVAMNAIPFGKSGLAGLHKVDGKLLSRAVARYAALGLQCDADGRVLSGRIFESQTDGKLEDFNYAFGGFFVVLKEGEVCRDFVRRGDSRSGAGLSADGRTLYLLAVEGELPGKSRGLSYPQCGEIFLAMGCRDALEFDGGGSSELCINGKSVMSYRVRRVQGNSFGLK